MSPYRKRGKLHEQRRSYLAGLKKSFRAVVEAEAVLLYWMIVSDTETRCFRR
jgi:hypothetical protein